MRCEHVVDGAGRGSRVTQNSKTEEYSEFIKLVAFLSRKLDQVCDMRYYIMVSHKLLLPNITSCYIPGCHIRLNPTTMHILCEYHRFHKKVSSFIKFYGGACGVMVIVVGNGHGDSSSNPG